MMNATRWLVGLLVCGGLLGMAGCAKTKPMTAATPVPKGAAPAGSGAEGATNKVIVTPAASLTGKVASVNVAGQFVVLTVQGGPMPVPDQRLSVYRAGLKVGVVKVTNQQMQANQVADIVAGEARVGDEVRPE